MLPTDITIRSLLDFGCGEGFVLRCLTKSTNSDLAVGIDISNFMLNLARENMPNGRFIWGTSLEAYPHPVDLIILTDILEHLPNPSAILNEAKAKAKLIAMKIPLEWGLVDRIDYRNRKAKATGLNVNTNGHLHKWTRRDALNLIENSGLRILKAKTINPPYELRFTTLIQDRSWFIRTYRIIGRKFEDFLCNHWHELHGILFGSHLFIVSEGQRSK